MVRWNRLAQLLKCPLCSWVGRYTRAYEPPRAMLQKNEYIENPKRYCYDNKEVTGQNRPSVIA